MIEHGAEDRERPSPSRSPGHGGAAPDFFVIGAYRSGTTSLYRLLRQHPDVFLPLEKEPNYYAVVDNPDASPVLRSRAVQTRAEYDRLYAAARPEQKRGDISPEYLPNPSAASRIAREHPRAPLVAILRNPIDRAWSDFLLHRRDGNEPCETLAEALADQERRQRDGDHRAGHYVDTGMYSGQLERYFDLFDREQIHILLYDDFARDPDTTLEGIFRHIGVDPSFRVEAESGVNASGVPKNKLIGAALRARARLRPYISRSILEKARPAWERLLHRALDRPSMPEADRRTLQDLYRPEIARLSTLLDRDLSHWLEK